MKKFYTPFLMLKILLCIFLFTSQIGFSQVTDWTKSWGNSIQIQKHQFQAGFGHVLVGTFIGTADFDPGTPVQNSTSTYNFIFILKLDTAGTFQWVQTIESDTFDYNIFIGDLKISAQQEIYITGNAQSIDLDPSTGIAQFNAYTLPTPTFLAKYSSVGNFLWHQNVYLPYTENALELDNFGNAYMFAIDHFGPINIIVGSDTISTVGLNNESVIVKYASSGTGMWAKKIRSNSPTSIYNYVQAKTMTIANDGSVIIAGEFRDSIDFDPSTSTDYYLNGSQINNLNYKSFFLLKLDANGDFLFASRDNYTNFLGYTNDIALDNQSSIYVIGKTTLDSISNQLHNYIKHYNPVGSLLWTKSIEGDSVSFEKLLVDSSNNLYVTGNFNKSSFSLDPQLITSTIYQIPSAATSGFLVRYDGYGNFIWYNQEYDSLDGSIYGHTSFSDLSLDSAGTIYVLNKPNSGLMKVTQDSCIYSFSIGVGSFQQISCTQSGQIMVTTIGGVTPIQYLWSTGDTGNLIFPGAPGVYTVIATSQNGCSSSLSVLMDAPNSGLGHDLDATIFGAANAVPGQLNSITLLVKNLSCNSVSGIAYFIMDSLSSFVSATIPPNSINGDTLFWNFSNMTYDSNHLIVQVNLLTDTLASLGTITQYTLNASPNLNDTDTTNNIVIASQIIQTSYDPNDITVVPNGKCDEGYIAPDQKLKYTIRFQNTGTSPAINIKIMDSLDLNLDLNTLRVLSSSHNMYTQLYPNNVVKFGFNMIHLADSNSNEPQSHGYIVFEIEPIVGLVTGAEIQNQVGIYFDYNTPVYTNTVSNTIYTGDWNNLACAFVGLEENKDQAHFVLYPNPANDKISVRNNNQFDASPFVQITDMEGRIVLETKYQPGEALDISNLKSGLYFLRIESEEGWVAKRFVKY